MKEGQQEINIPQCSTRQHDNITGSAPLLDALTINDKSEDVLHKLLSTKFAISGSSVFVEQYHESLRYNSRCQLPKSKSSSPLRAIGWGSCGIVYEQIGTTHILKRAIKGNTALAKECRLPNDLLMHRMVEEAFAKTKCITYAYEYPVQVPRLYNYLHRNDRPCWTTTAQLFREHDRTPEDLLIAERIPPINLVARHALIDLYCPAELKAGAKIQDSNDDCLVRLYLGKRRDHTIRRIPRRFFGLRNFPLCLDQMQELELDTMGFASAMAHALATMHWKAKIDAADVEFALGGPPSLAHEALPTSQHISEQLQSPTESVYGQTVTSEYGVTHVWLLDFNQCQPMAMDVAGVDQAVKRFFDNDPYYPRPSIGTPGDRDEKLWARFEEVYLTVSYQLIDVGNEKLPQLFMRRIREVMLLRTKRKAEAAQRSDTYSEFDQGAGTRDAL